MLVSFSVMLPDSKNGDVVYYNQSDAKDKTPNYQVLYRYGRPRYLHTIVTAIIYAIEDTIKKC